MHVHVHVYVYLLLFVFSAGPVSGLGTIGNNSLKLFSRRLLTSDSCLYFLYMYMHIYMF